MSLNRRTKLERIVPLLLLAVAACGTSNGQPNPPPTPQITALLVVSTNEPLRVPGSDGQEHLEYDLVMTNVFSDPVTLTSIDVLDSEDTVLLHLEGDRLAAQTRPVFLGPMPIVEVPVAGAVATIMDIVLPPGAIPQRLTHRISYTVPDTFLAALLTSRTIDGPELTVDPRLPVVLAPPLRGPGWLNSSGCCSAPVAHRSLRVIVDGMHTSLNFHCASGSPSGACGVNNTLGFHS